MNVYEQDVLVVKVGTNTLIEKQADGSEQLDSVSFARIGRQVLELQEAGTGVVIVSSGAITAGMVQTGLRQRPNKKTHMHELQRLASIGWRHVLNEWGQALPGATIGELLLTRHQLDLDQERDEAIRTTHTLLTHGDTPTANENDAITHQEIKFGDNDTLAAIKAACIARSPLFSGRVRLVLLSDIHGVYRNVHDETSVIREISDLSAYEHLAGESATDNGTGGMVTKFGAAKIAGASGVDMWIAHGRTEDAIARTMRGEIGTHFVS